MKTHFRSALIALSALMICSAASAFAAPAIRITQHDTHLDVTIDGKPFTTYWFRKRSDRPYVRPFFDPVLAVGEVPMTSDQYAMKLKDPKNKKIDHPHHQGLYVAQGDVNGADQWTLEKGANQPKQRHLGFDRVGNDGFVEKLEWEDKDHQPILNETRTVHFQTWPDGSRGIEITSAFTPMKGEVTFGDTKEAGLCAVRMTHAISDHDPQITLSSGAKGEKASWGKPADWCDESGMVDGKPYGIAILDAPSNPKHPARWHVRAYGLMASNIFGLHDYDKKKFPAHSGDFKMEPGKTVTFKHLVVIHPGLAADAGLEAKYAQFSHQQ